MGKAPTNHQNPASHTRQWLQHVNKYGSCPVTNRENTTERADQVYFTLSITLYYVCSDKKSHPPPHEKRLFKTLYLSMSNISLLSYLSHIYIHTH
jgi:hypothetical protein